MLTKETQETFEKYRESFSAICNELCELGLHEHDKRTEEIALFKFAINNGLENMLNESRR